MKVKEDLEKKVGKQNADNRTPLQKICDFIGTGIRVNVYGIKGYGESAKVEIIDENKESIFLCTDTGGLLRSYLFCSKKLPQGTYEVKVSHEDYEPQSKRVTIVNPFVSDVNFKF